MANELILEKYLDALLQGNRQKCRSIIERTLQSGMPANLVYMDVIWPVMTQVERLLREDRIAPVAEHLAVRINRTIVDQLQNKLPRRSHKDKKITVCCARDELQELGAQMLFA